MCRLSAFFALWLCSGCAPEGPSAYIDFNLVPDQECVYDPGGEIEFFGVGFYDIAVSGGPDGRAQQACARPYVLNLRVNSGLRTNVDKELGRAEPNVLQVTQVEVKLMTQDKEVLSFGASDPPLPNPFLVTTTFSLDPSDTDEASRGVAKVEAIPTPYATQLAQFDGGQVLAEIQMFGTTLGDVDVEFQPYLYPVRICNGCMSLCLNDDIMDANLTTEDILDKNECQDGAGADGRVCIDPNC